VRSVHNIEALHTAWERFGGELGNHLQAAEREIGRALDWLQERLAYWRAEVQRRQALYEEAAAALVACRSVVYQDPRTGATYRSPCIPEQQAAQIAAARLAEGRTRLQEVQTWLQRVEQAVTAYQAKAQAVQRNLAGDQLAAAGFLQASVTELQAYLAAEALPGLDASPGPVGLTIGPASAANSSPAPAPVPGSGGVAGTVVGGIASLATARGAALPPSPVPPAGGAPPGLPNTPAPGSF
jgi:hypothetical protein